MTDPVATALEQHAHALRELARALVGAGDADDVMQATAAAALVRPHAVRAPLAFLRHVLRVQAHRHHRGEARRRRRENAHAKARSAAAPPAEHALEQREAVAQLHRALMAVPQPHLGALLLRYFEDLSPTAIAERLAVPLPTIKSRLQRGLELLREQLDRHGPRDRWQHRLGIAFGLPPAAFVRSGAAVPLLGALAMKLVAAVLFVGVAATVWLVWPAGDVAPPATNAVAATEPAPARAAQAAMPLAPVPEASRSVAADSPTATARLVGRVTNHEGAPLAGAKLTVLPPSVFDAAAIATATTDAAGAFTCDAPPGEHVVRIAAARHVGLYSNERSFAAGSTTDLGTIVLRPGIVVRGRVVDRDGSVVGGTPVNAAAFSQHATPPEGWWWWRRAVPTDHAGRFELDPVLPLEYRLHLAQEQLLDPVELQLAPGQDDVELEVRVESASRQLTISGRVVDESGRGIRDAKLIATERLDAGDRQFPATSGDDGTFSIRRLVASAPQRPVVLTAVAPGRDETRIEDVAWRRQDLEVVLRPLAELTLRVVDTKGIPVPSYTVRLSPLTLRGGITWHAAGFAVHEADATSDGEHTIRNLPRSSYDVHVSPADPALAPSDVQRVDVAGPLQRATVVLQPRVRRALHLRGPDGAPVAGASVELCRPGSRAIDLDSHVVVLERWTFVHLPGKSLLVQRVSTDANGDATFDGPAATPLVLRVLGPGCLPFVTPIERLDGDGPIVVDCRRGGTVRIVAEPADVLAAFETLSSVERDEHRARAWLQRERGAVRECMPAGRDDARPFARDGIATIDGVPDGTWVPHVAFGGEELVLPAVVVADGAARDVPLDLAPLRPVTIRGRVVAETPVAGRSVIVERLRGAGEVSGGSWAAACRGYIALDDTGAFVLRALPGRFRLLQCHQRADGDHADLLAQPADVDVAPGATCEQTFTIAIGTVALRFVDREQRPVAGVEGAWVGRKDGLAAYLPPSDETGRTRFEGLEVGSVRLAVLPRRFGPARTAVPKLYAQHPNERDILERTVIELESITVARGTPVEHTIVLPDAWFR